MIPHLILPDGRKLAYTEYGAGVPVFFFHGTPGSHLLPERDTALAQRLGLRLIVPVRPGYGQSDFQPERTLLDWPADVLALADALGIDQFGIIGVSGGGPFAAACAYKIPERLTRVALVSSLAPFDLLGEQPQPLARERRAFKKHQIETEPDKWLEAIFNGSSESDRIQLAQIGAELIAGVRESYRQGVDGVVHEDRLLLTQPWGFALEAIRANVSVWQGEADQNVLPKHGRFLAEHIPNCVVHYVPGVGHLMPERQLIDIFSSFINPDDLC